MRKIKIIFSFLKDWLKNIFVSTFDKKIKLFYVVESADWVIKRVGKYIMQNLNKQNLLKTRITTIHLGLKNKIINFGSINTFLTSSGFKKVHKSNKVVVTWFHFVSNEKRNKNILDAQKNIDLIHTSCNITKNELINLGIAPEKIVVIPLGVDLSLFKPLSFEKKQKIRKELGIPSDKIVIGSFLKDGVGWGEGLEPKLIKGPDIFVKVVEKLAKKYPIFVLLTGPARGYVKKRLELAGIPYKHSFLKDYQEISKYYQALDLYIVTSRIEGGPKAILESMASGIPLVSTKVGMAPDVIKNSINGFMTKVNDVDSLVKSSSMIIENEDVKSRLIKEGLKTVKKYSWEKIVRQYYDKIYSKLKK